MNRFMRALFNRVLGDRGERAAARYLARQGFRIITRGHRSRRGEIDLIAREGNVLVFIEVKTRRAGQPAEAVTPEKQRRLTNVTLEFLKRHGLLEQRCRLDVIAIVWADSSREPVIEHIRNAFEPPGQGQFFR